MHDYRKLYKMLATHYRLWIYNGQDDGCIPYVGAQASSQPSVCRRLLSSDGYATIEAETLNKTAV